MNGHLSNQTVERFHSEALTKGDRTEIYNHILRCEPCRKLVVTPETGAVAVAALTDHLLPQTGDEPYHLDANRIEAFVDDKLDPLDRSTARLHLEDCAECSDELTDFRGRRLGLLVLDPDQGTLVLAVIEEDLKDTIREQRDSDHRDEQRDIFRKQAAAGLGAGWRRRRRAKHRRSRQRPAFGRVRVQRNGHQAQPSKMARACLLSHCGKIIRSPRRPAQAGSRGRSNRALSPP